MQLDPQEEAEFHAVLVEAVSRRAATGWPNVDEGIIELKRRSRTATTPQDYRDVGNRCVAALEALSVDTGAHAEERAHESRAAQ